MPQKVVSNLWRAHLAHHNLAIALQGLSHARGAEFTGELLH
eukprot:CAMPEP_0115357350 /NCGR_PEP_ID=MMETSP0270-20121206/100102_1 /TAXON_ID=71861 /ORGANISM="Scrippsiella trochoidea, Strain CCMP3099" /LENGTH=40 /DNA_ID= /DNA_START= /DNA_END= /DNA_ORIENTATION=